jgi:hypothetical protein
MKPPEIQLPVQKSGCGKYDQIGNEKRLDVDRIN